MPTFSERNGHKPARSVIQIDSFDAETRVAIWNIFVALQGSIDNPLYWQVGDRLASEIWRIFYKRPLDEYRSSGHVWLMVKESILKSNWNEALDVVEFLVQSTDDWRGIGCAEDLTTELNYVFEEHLVGYRYIAEMVTPIDSQQALAAIEAAQEETAAFPGAQHHLSNALAKLSDRSRPDYANSVKESLSAVESMGETLTGESTLGKALDRLATVGIAVHPAQLRAWKAMYGWASDEGGIRHSAQAPPTVDQATAKYTLITSSAFISLLIDASLHVTTVS